MISLIPEVFGDGEGAERAARGELHEVVLLRLVHRRLRGLLGLRGFHRQGIRGKVDSLIFLVRQK